MKIKLAHVIAPLCLSLTFCFAGCKDDDPAGDEGSDTTDTTDGTEYGYSPEEVPVNVVEEYDLPSEFSASISFEYNETAGRPAAADLTVGVDSEGPLFQVFSENQKPFGVAGLTVKPLDPTVTYELSIDGNSMTLRNVDLNEVVLTQEIDLDRALKLSIATPSKELFAAPVDVVEAGVR